MIALCRSTRKPQAAAQCSRCLNRNAMSEKGSSSDSGERDCEVGFTPMNRDMQRLSTSLAASAGLALPRSREGKGRPQRDETHTSGLFEFNSEILRMKQAR